MTVPISNVTSTWSNTSITYTGIGYNATDNGSSSASMLMHLKSNNTSRFAVDKRGNISVSGNTNITTSLGVGTAASGTTGEIRATNEVTAYYTSDIKFKTNIVPIQDATYKIKQIQGVMFDWKDDYIDKRGGEDGYFVRKHDTGVIAQEIEAILPEIVAVREDGSKAVKYDKLIPLLIEALKDALNRIEILENKS